MFDPLSKFRAEAAKIRKHYMSNPKDLNFICHQRPKFASMVMQEDLNELTQFLKKQYDEKMKKNLEIKKKIVYLNLLNNFGYSPCWRAIPLIPSTRSRYRR